MSEDLFNFFMIMCIVSIFGMAFFCAVKPKVRIARWFYLLFGVTLIPIAPRLAEDAGSKWLMIWPLLFSLCGFLGFFGITKSLKQNPDKEEELNQKFHEESIKGGKRRLLKNLFRNKK